MNTLRLGLTVAGLAAASCFTALANTLAPARLPAGSQSADKLKKGPYRRATAKHTLRDNSRGTDPNGNFPGRAYRELPLKIWYPAANGQNPAPDKAPLLVYSHGLSGSRDDPAYLGRFLASHGYTLVSVNFPLTQLGAPGGPNLLDVVNQPADIRFIIDSLLEWNASADHFLSGRIDSTTRA